MMPKTGGTPTTLASGRPEAIAVNATQIFWSDISEGLTQGTIMAMPIGGGTPNVLTSGQDLINLIALDTTNLYWTDLGTESILMMPLGGGTPTTIATEINALPEGLVANATSLYWDTANLSDAKHGEIYEFSTH
jgi:hypothetical protein